MTDIKCMTESISHDMKYMTVYKYVFYSLFVTPVFTVYGAFIS